MSLSTAQVISSERGLDNDPNTKAYQSRLNMALDLFFDKYDSDAVETKLSIFSPLVLMKLSVDPRLMGALSLIHFARVIEVEPTWLLSGRDNDLKVVDKPVYQPNTRRRVTKLNEMVFSRAKVQPFSNTPVAPSKTMVTDRTIAALIASGKAPEIIFTP